MINDEPRLWGVIDTEYIAPDGDDQCHFRLCNLYDGHDGPHFEAHPLSGRIFGSWINDEREVFGPEDLPEEVVSIVRELNEARDEAVEAVRRVLDLQHELQFRHKESTDPHVQALLTSNIWPKGEYDIPYSGTETDSEEGIREELLDILGLNPEEF